MSTRRRCIRPQMAPDGLGLGRLGEDQAPCRGRMGCAPGQQGTIIAAQGPGCRATAHGTQVSEGCMQLLRTGDSGPAVAEVRSALREFGLLTPLAAGAPDDHYDSFVEGAVRAFQQQRGLITDGIVGPATYRALREARWTLGDRMLGLMISAPMAGDDVFALQERLLELGFDTGRPGGVFDAQTEKALRAFQREYGLNQDGICGPATLRALRQLGRKVTGGRPGLLREQERVRKAGPRLRGKRIVIDPGHGGPDRGVMVADVAEADLMWDLARRLEGRMAAT